MLKRNDTEMSGGGRLDALRAAGTRTAVLPDDADLLLLGLQPRSRSFYESVAKPVIDRLVAAVMCVLLAPLLAAVAVAIATTLGRPVLLRQQRIGLHGRPFAMLKFRTMQPDRRRGDAAGWIGEDRRRTHKSVDDPRHVPLGRFLRKWSLDELPQLLNVVRGDMSLVGPRPELVSIVERHYQPWQHARHQVKPGLTGLWQVTERGVGMMHEHVATDLRYVKSMSLWTDLKILALTVPSALGLRRGF